MSRQAAARGIDGQAEGERLTWTVDEVAAMLGVGETNVRDRIRAGEIPVLRLGRRIVIPKAQFQRWFEARAEQAEQAVRA